MNKLDEESVDAPWGALGRCNNVMVRKGINKSQRCSSVSSDEISDVAAQCAASVIEKDGRRGRPHFQLRIYVTGIMSKGLPDIDGGECGGLRM
jgi:hypothetical protein